MKYDIISTHSMKTGKKTKMIFSVGGGKGGVGKTIFSVAFGTLLAREGFSVALVDLDLGAANMHTCLGILKKTPTIADFIMRKVTSLEEVLIETSQKNMQLISGSEFVAGMANPAHWMKLKIMRHIKSLPADFIIVDLGAGVHFNTLDFFSMSDRGIVITAPEPGAVMNAYSFIKGALFRRLQSVFKKHPEIGPIIETETKRTDRDKSFTLEWLAGQVRKIAPDMLPLIREIELDFNPALVVNQTTEGRKHVLVKNLMTLCSERLGITIEHTGNLPNAPAITHYLLNIPEFLDTLHGKPYHDALQNIADKLVSLAEIMAHESQIKTDFSDEEVEGIISFMDSLADTVFSGTDRNRWKLRMYFKPSDVVDFLVSRGIHHEAFYQ